MGSPVKTQVENGLNTILDFRGQNFDVYAQAVFPLKDLCLHEKQEKKINISEPLK